MPNKSEIIHQILKRKSIRKSEWNGEIVIRKIIYTNILVVGKRSAVITNQPWLVRQAELGASYKVRQPQ